MSTHSDARADDPAASSDGSQGPTNAGSHPDAAWIAHCVAATEAWLHDGHPLPTSSITGSGAIDACEHEFGSRHDGRPALLLPSGTSALRAALLSLGVGLGDEVIMPVIDWPASAAAARSVGAIPVVVDVDRTTMTISPDAARSALSSRTRAIIACHLAGVPADIPALRTHCAGIPIIEDAATALGSTLDGQLLGTMGDAAAFSFGPGKQIDAGEGGMLLTASAALHERATRCSMHPIRQRLAGVENPQADALEMRPHPLAAILAWHQLSEWQPEADREQHDAAAATIAAGLADRGVIVGADRRRSNAAHGVPVLAARAAAETIGQPSGAQIVDSSAATPDSAVHGLLERLRIVSV